MSSPSSASQRTVIVGVVWSAATLVTSAQVPIWSSVEPTSGARFGFAVATLPDLDGDLVDDFIVGVPFGAAGSPPSAVLTPAPLAMGRCRVVSGKSGETLLELAGPGMPGDLFGYSVAVIGDTNLDGVPDFMVGAPRHDSAFAVRAGSVGIYNGATGALRYRIFGEQQDHFFGVAVASPGDMNLDGLADGIAGAPFVDGPNGIDSGRVRVFAGFVGSTMKTLHGASAGDRFGATLTTLADISGDGIADFAVGAPFGYDAISQLRPGRVSLHSASGTQLAAVAGVADGDRFGAAIAAIADFTSDGKGDLLVGAPGFDGVLNDTGSVSIVSTQTAQVVFSVAGNQGGEALGSAVLAVPALDAHPAPDFVAGTGDGRVEFFGGNGASLGALSGVGGFGFSLALGADLDGDGERELVVGAPWAGSGPATETGRLSCHAGPTIAGKLAFTDPAPPQFSIVPGQSPSAVTREVVGLGFGAQDFSVAIPPTTPWLLVTPPTGTIGGLDDRERLTISLDLAQLPTANAESTITLVDPATLSPLASLVVKVVPATVGADPQLCATATSLDFVAPAGLPAPAPLELTIENCGNPDLLLSATAHVEPPDATWVALSRTAITIAPGTASQNLLVTCDSTALSPGLHFATVRVTNDAIPSQSIELPVTALVGSVLFAPGDKLRGTLDALDSSDLAVFHGIDGMAVEFKGGPKNGSQPRFTLVGPDGIDVDTWAPQNSKTKKGFLLDRAGVWRLRVESSDGLGGDFQVKTKRDGLPANAKSFSKLFTIADPPLLTLDLGALPGGRIDLAKITTQTQPIGELTFQLVMPTGAAFDLASFDQLGSKAYSLVDVPLDLGGVWRLRIGQLGFESKLKVEVALVQPAVGKSIVTID